MTLSGHIATAGIILRFIHNPAALITANIVLHPLLDAIPHAEWSTFRNTSPKQILVIIADSIAAIWLIWLIFININLPPWLIAAVLLSSLWLDIIDIPTRIWWKKLRHYHEYLHTWPQEPINPVDWSKTATGKTPAWLKILIQSWLVLVAIIIISRN